MTGLEKRMRVLRGIFTGLTGFLFLGFFTALAGEGFASPQLSFSVENEIFVAPSSGESPRKVAQGYDPEISPSGNSVAFTFYTDEGNRIPAVVNLATGEQKLFTSVPGENSYGPRWSPDEKFLLFNHWDQGSSNWVVGVLALEDEAFRILAPERQGLYSPFWSASGTSIYAQDLDNLYKIDVASGRVTETVRLSSLLGESFASSALHFAVSPKGDAWLFDGEVEGGSQWNHLEMPIISAVFLYTPKDGKVRRITGENICAMHPAWLPEGGEFLFAGYTPEGSRGMDFPLLLFRRKLDDPESLRRLFRGQYPSSSR